jgi:hypothetical protein
VELVTGEDSSPSQRYQEEKLKSPAEPRAFGAATKLNWIHGSSDGGLQVVVVVSQTDAEKKEHPLRCWEAERLEKVHFTIHNPRRII